MGFSKWIRGGKDSSIYRDDYQENISRGRVGGLMLRIGDKVFIVDRDDMHSWTDMERYINTVGTITEIAHSNKYGVTFPDGRRWWYRPTSLLPVDKYMMDATNHGLIVGDVVWYNGPDKIAISNLVSQSRHYYDEWTGECLVVVITTDPNKQLKLVAADGSPNRSFWASYKEVSKLKPKTLSEADIRRAMGRWVE